MSKRAKSSEEWWKNLKKYATEISPNIVLVERFVPGYQTTSVREVDKSGNIVWQSFLVDEISEHVGGKTYAVRIGHEKFVDPALIIRQQSGIFSLLYNEVRPAADNPLFSSDIVLLRHTTAVGEEDIEIFDRRESAELAKLSSDLASMKTRRELTAAFLKDPWAGYRKKEEVYKQKLIKAREATKKAIKEAEKGIIEVDKKIDEIQQKMTELLTGRKKKIGKED